MGYSKNPAVLEARRDALRELELGRACRWRTTPDPLVTDRKLYQLREALYIASLYPERYPALAQAYRAFSLRAAGPGLIEAVARAPSGSADLALTHPSDTPIHGLGGTSPVVPLVGLTTAKEVIDSWKLHLPSLDPLHFQQTRLPVEELTVLWHWAKDVSVPALMILVGDGFLTLSLRDAEVQDYAWSPPKAPAPPEKDYDV